MTRGRGVVKIQDVYDDDVRQAILEQTSRIKLVDTVFTTIPGVVSGAAYADGDALGLQFAFGVPTSGTITRVLLGDMDKEALAVELLLFRDAFTGGTDNSAFDMADADRTKVIGPITVTSFTQYNDNALGHKELAYDYVAPNGLLYVQAITRGVQNLSASTDYGVQMTIEDHS